MYKTRISLTADLRGQYWIPDRREGKRRRFNIGMAGHLTLDPEKTPVEVWLADLSEKGIGFFSTQPLDRGTVIAITLARHGGEPATLAAKVAHSTKWDNREWLVGCEFAEALTVEMVEDLLTAGP